MGQRSASELRQPPVYIRIISVSGHVEAALSRDGGRVGVPGLGHGRRGSMTATIRFPKLTDGLCALNRAQRGMQSMGVSTQILGKGLETGP